MSGAPHTTAVTWEIGDFVRIAGNGGGQPSGWIVKMGSDGEEVHILTARGDMRHGAVIGRGQTTNVWRAHDYGFNEGVRVAVRALYAHSQRP